MKLPKLKSTLLRYILLFTQAVFLPVLVILLSLLFTNNALRAEVLNSNRSAVQLIQKSMDSTFTEISDMLDHIGANERLTQNRLQNNPRDALDTLSDVASSHKCVAELILYVRGGENFYAINGMFSKEHLHLRAFLEDFRAAGLSENDWLDLMESATEPIYWSSVATDNATYLCVVSPVFYPLQTNDAKASRSATVLLRQEYVQDLFRSSQTTSQESILLLGSDYTLLSKLTTEETDNLVPDICAYIKENEAVVEDGYAELPGTATLLFASRSTDTGLIYVRFLPSDVAYRTMNIQRTFTIIIFIITLILGVVLISTGIRHSYVPLQSLAQWIRDRRPEDGNIHDELALFRSVLNDAFDRNEALLQVVDTSRQSLVERLLADLLCGNYATEEDFRSACDQLDVHLDGKYFAVCSLLIEEDGTGADSVDFDRIFNCISKAAPECYRLQAKDLLFTRRFILVISTDNSDTKFYQNTLSDIKNHLLEEEKLMVSIGMGAFYDSYSKAARSYVDSVKALDYRLVYGKNCLITPDIYNSSSPEMVGSYPSYDLDLLDTALSSRNSEMATTVLKRINATVKLKNYNLELAKYICYDIFSILKKSADFADITSSPLPRPLNVTNLTNHNTIDDFFTALTEFIESRLGAAKQQDIPSAATAGDKLLEYADAHCLEYDFQIKNMAEHFGISPQYMRKLFKSHAGMSVSEYVSNKRLERSMYLLAQTEMPLQEIVSAIGNSDISGFVRFFKQKTGLTPGQYRKTHQKSEDKVF